VLGLGSLVDAVTQFTRDVHVGKVLDKRGLRRDRERCYYVWSRKLDPVCRRVVSL
jgi:hypothetical protein